MEEEKGFNLKLGEEYNFYLESGEKITATLTSVVEGSHLTAANPKETFVINFAAIVCVGHEDKNYRKN